MKIFAIVIIKWLVSFSIKYFSFKQRHDAFPVINPVFGQIGPDYLCQGRKEIHGVHIGVRYNAFLCKSRPVKDERDTVAAFERLRDYARAAGRNPSDVGIEVWVSVGSGTPSDWQREFEFWRDAGVTHITLVNADSRYRYGHVRITGRTLDAHLDAMERYWRAIEGLR